MTLKHSLLGLILMGAVACGGKDPPVNVGEEDTDLPLDLGNGTTAPAPYAGITWEIDTVEAGQTAHPVGDVGKLARAEDGTLYYAYLASEASTPSDCRNLSAFSQTDQVPGVRYQLHVAVKPAGGPFNIAVERVPVENAGSGLPNFIGARLGLDAIVDTNGELLVVTPGGANGQFTCAASDLLFGRRSASGTYAMKTAASESSDCCSGCPVGQNACTTGSDTGYYPSIALRQSGSIAVTYLDEHLVTDNDGKNYADFELVNVSGAGPSNNSFQAIDLFKGSGFWGTLRFKGTLGLAAASSAVSRVPQLFTSDNGAAWVEKDLQLDGKVLGRVQLEIALNGTIGIVYYESEDSRGATSNRVRYCETSDLDNPFDCVYPEKNALVVAGAQPSLAYDSHSRPVISYYYCGSGNCVHDGLRFSWRDDNGAWWNFNVQNVDNNRSGFWSSVQVDPITDEPTIVFQDLTKGSALVAYGHFVK